MWADAGLLRSGDDLRRAAAVLASWRAEPRRPRTRAEFEDENLLLVAAQVVDAALARTASIGAHFRNDDATTRVGRSEEMVTPC